jgi:dTDP-4-amino-4,6-dideoxygalactose transaminase
VKRYRIPFNKPKFMGDELRYIADAVERGHLSGDGLYTRMCSELLERELAVPKVLLTTSCTHALEMCALLLDLQPGDEVIVPSYAFVTTAGAFVLHGARPVFADVHPDTLNLDASLIRDLITPRTRAIVALHYAGVACEMDEILAISSETGVPVVEDNAHGLFGRYKGKALGSLGALATQSFHETKNFTSGEGGALIINEPRWIERAEILREKGTNRSRFFRGEVDKYSWVDVGSSYLPSEILSAFLYAQLEARDLVFERRRALWTRYREELAGWAGLSGVELPVVPDSCESPYHMFHLLLPNRETRTALIDHLARRDILAVFHYLPLHLSEMGRRLGGRPGMCPVTEDVSDRLLRLPFYTGLEASEQQEVIGAVREFDGC